MSNPWVRRVEVLGTIVAMFLMGCFAFSDVTAPKHRARLRGADVEFVLVVDAKEGDFGHFNSEITAFCGLEACQFQDGHRGGATFTTTPLDGADEKTINGILSRRDRLEALVLDVPYETTDCPALSSARSSRGLRVALFGAPPLSSGSSAITAPGGFAFGSASFSVRWIDQEALDAAHDSLGNGLRGALYSICSWIEPPLPSESSDISEVISSVTTAFRSVLEKSFSLSGWDRGVSDAFPQLPCAPEDAIYDRYVALPSRYIGIVVSSGLVFAFGETGVSVFEVDGGYVDGIALDGLSWFSVFGNYGLAVQSNPSFLTVLDLGSDDFFETISSVHLSTPSPPEYSVVFRQGDRVYGYLMNRGGWVVVVELTNVEAPPRRIGDFHLRSYSVGNFGISVHDGHLYSWGGESHVNVYDIDSVTDPEFLTSWQTDAYHVYDFQVLGQYGVLVGTSGLELGKVEDDSFSLIDVEIGSSDRDFLMRSFHLAGERGYVHESDWTEGTVQSDRVGEISFCPD